MKGWFGKLECEEPAIIEEPLCKCSICQAHFCLVLIVRIQMTHNFKRHIQAQRHIQYTVLRQIQFVEACDLVTGQEQDRLI